MRLLSKTCLYGIRAALFVASVEDRKFVSIRRISSELGISFYFLTKILQTLTHHKIMVSYRGPNGGVSLARSASDITLMELIDIIETENCLNECVLGLKGCGEGVPCPLHDEWSVARDGIKNMFSGTTLAELGRKIKDDGFRLIS